MFTKFGVNTFNWCMHVLLTSLATQYCGAWLSEFYQVAQDICIKYMWFCDSHMQVNRCTPCSNGTYSLSATSPYGCLPCPDDQGAFCSLGHLIPKPGFFQRDPLLPQLLACPLIGACRVEANPWAMRMQLQGLLALQRPYQHQEQSISHQEPQQQQQGGRRRLVGVWSGGDALQRPNQHEQGSISHQEPQHQQQQQGGRKRLVGVLSGSGVMVSAWGSHGGGSHRRLRQAAEPPMGPGSGGAPLEGQGCGVDGLLAAALQAAASRCGLSGDGSDGSGGGGSADVAEGPRNSSCEYVDDVRATDGSRGSVNRTCVLLEMQRHLAEAFTNTDEKDLIGRYSSETLAWQQMQCQAGYTGDLCGTCMPGLTAEAAAAVEAATGVPPSEAEMRGFGRLRFRCVACKGFGAEIAVLIVVFLAQCVYIALGVMLQVRAPKRVLLARGATRVTRHCTVTHPGDSGASGVKQQPPEGGKRHKSTRVQQGIRVGLRDLEGEILGARRRRGGEVGPGFEGDNTGLSEHPSLGVGVFFPTEPSYSLEPPIELFNSASTRDFSSETSFWGQFTSSSSGRALSSLRLLRRSQTTFRRPPAAGAAAAAAPAAVLNAGDDSCSDHTPLAPKQTPPSHLYHPHGAAAAGFGSPATDSRVTTAVQLAEIYPAEHFDSTAPSTSSSGQEYVQIGFTGEPSTNGLHGMGRPAAAAAHGMAAAASHQEQQQGVLVARQETFLTARGDSSSNTPSSSSSSSSLGEGFRMSSAAAAREPGLQEQLALGQPSRGQARKNGVVDESRAPCSLQQWLPPGYSFGTEAAPPGAAAAAAGVPADNVRRPLWEWPVQAGPSAEHQGHEGLRHGPGRQPVERSGPRALVVGRYDQPPQETEEGPIDQLEGLGGPGKVGDVEVAARGQPIGVDSGGSSSEEEQVIKPAPQKMLPAATLVGIWKILTNYLQVRHRA